MATIAIMALQTRVSRGSWMVPLGLGLVLAVLANTPHSISGHVPPLGALGELLGRPPVEPIVDAGSALLILWGLVRLIMSGSPDRRLARRLQRRGDLDGAAEIWLREGDRRRALSLFTRARSWIRASQIAHELGRELDAAALLRKASGSHLEEASRIYRRHGDLDAARRCDHELAEWLLRRGRFDDAIQAWVRAGEPRRAVAVASLALDGGRLRPSHPALDAARRAADELRDHTTLARLFEVEGRWEDAARAWRSAGEHLRAADSYRRAERFAEAAAEEAAAGRPKHAAAMRLRRLREAQRRLETLQTRGDRGIEDAIRLRHWIRTETEGLLPQLHEQGLVDELIELLTSSGRTEEAVRRLNEMGRADAAAEVAREAERWDLAGPMLEQLERWGEASDVYELAGDLTSAARCAERAGENERSLELYRGLGDAVGAAHSLARMGQLQDALILLHRAARLDSACEILAAYPGPVPDIPDVIVDIAGWAREQLGIEKAISCLQRAVIGVALQAGRLDPAVALATLLKEAGEIGPAHELIERVLGFDYSHTAARELKREIEGLMVETSPTPTSSREAPAPAVHVPSTQQRYEILTELGRGGMGVVYKARDTRLEREVAIKVLRTTSKDEVLRLEQEAKVAATLNHPGIVTVYDFEAGFDGYFIAMEYVPGAPLDQLLKSDPGRVRRDLVSLLTALADAIDYAHRHRVIHRDLKPGNVLLTPSAEVKILDFGIAARLDLSTSAPAVSGTPYYMAPEQIRGETLTSASDIYSFGATAFHLATGRPPFTRGNVINAHLQEEPVDPSTIDPDIDPDLSRIILRCLAKDPADRYPTALELHRALRDLAH